MNSADALYQQAIKDWAQADHGHGRLDEPDAEVRLDNPLCGDRIQLGLRLDAGRIAALAQDTRGCLLCRAAASLLAARAPGLTAAELDAAADSLAVLLAGDALQTPWPELEMFAPVHAHPSRHKCALLPFNALRKAIRAAGSAS